MALARAGRVYEKPLQDIIRYFTGDGKYPCSLTLRTPLGLQKVSLFCSVDSITVHEIFCREDYGFPNAPEMVVDIGSNIGISALYFLTRSESTHCELYEPDPRNIDKLKANLVTFESRFTLYQSAVADREGVLPFTRESTGRYGSLDPVASIERKGEKVTVRVEHINTVLERALAKATTIDILKVDTEGSELATILAIDPLIRRRIRHIVIEWRDHNVAIDGFRTAARCDALRLTNKRIAAH
jgi:FkbM family methyltransferase